MNWKKMMGLALGLLLAGCATGMGDRVGALERAQYAWSAAIRWGDLEGAWLLVDPQVRAGRELDAFERERWQQVRISSYRVISVAPLGEDGSRRDVEIGVVNQHTMAERQVRHQERWRWDPSAKAWYVASGLPDLWDGR